MAKYNVELEFVPTRENAQELLLDLATIAGDWAKQTTLVDHDQCVSLEAHEAAIEQAKAPLLERIEELREQQHDLPLSVQVTRDERDEALRQRDAVTRQYNTALQKLREQDAELGRLKKEATSPPAPVTDGRTKNRLSREYLGMPHVGELVKLVPRPETGGQWFGGVVKAIHGKGGSGGIEVLPKGHGRTVLVRKNQIKRYAVHERADQEALAREMGVPVG